MTKERILSEVVLSRSCSTKTTNTLTKIKSKLTLSVYIKLPRLSVCVFRIFEKRADQFP